ncbi:MAG: cytochrome P460 family protein [Vicinamibacteria bacterium]
MTPTRIAQSVACALALCAGVLLTAHAADTSRVPFPEGYRSWFHVKTATIDEGHPGFAARGGIHHIYANPLAIKGYETGTFPDGSVIAYDELEFKAFPNRTSAEGARKRVDVMVKDKERFKDTDGWGYESFMKDSRTLGALSQDQAKACASCHAAKKDRDRVFSEIRS